MYSEISYTASKQIDEKIKNKHYIPYRINSPQQKYRVHNLYYNAYWGSFFKVLEVNYDKYGCLEDCTIRWDDGNYGLICTNLDVNADFNLKCDRNNLHELYDIVNSEEIYTGAEIVYWFFVHNITCFNNKYKGFWKFVDSSSAHRISDYSRYIIIGDLQEDGTYTNCKIVKVKSS